MRINAAVLRRDTPYQLASIAGIACALVLTVAVMMARLPAGAGWMESRGTPGYWLTMLPAAVWVWSLISHARWATAMLPVVLGGTPIALAALALAAGTDARAYWITAAAMLLPALAGLWWCRRCTVWRAAS